MLNDSALPRESDTPYLSDQKESPLRSGYESSGVPRGRLTKRFRRVGGEADRIGAAYSSDPITRWRTHLISRFARESHSRELHCSRGDLPCTDTS